MLLLLLGPLRERAVGERQSCDKEGPGTSDRQWFPTDVGEAKEGTTESEESLPSGLGQ
jgi:hypothetical protein